MVVGAEPRRLRPVDREQVEPGQEVVAAPPGELGRQLRGPVGAVHLEAVAEDRSDQRGWDGVQHRVTDRPQVGLGGCGGVVVEHRTLGAGRCALDVLAGPAGVREQHHPRTGSRLDHQPAVTEGLPGVRVRRLLERAVADVAGDQLVARPRWDDGHIQGTGADRAAVPVQLARRQRIGDVRPAEGPAAAQREVEPQPELVRPVGGEPEVGQELGGAELGGCGTQRVDEGDLHPTDTRSGHRGELPIQLAPGHRRPEPPPAHHRRRVPRGIGEAGAKFSERGLRAQRGHAG